RLNNPAKFLPHFLPLQSQGYEIVAGGGDLLVFKKVQDHFASIDDAPPLERTNRVEPRQDPSYSNINPIDGTTTGIGNFASPTGFVNYDVLSSLPPDEPVPFAETTTAKEPSQTAPPGSVPKVRREEVVFSGQKMKKKHAFENDK